jgi:hypothetical protein
MSADRNNTLKLRKHSIRTLTFSDLRVVVGGYVSTQGGGAGHTSGGGGAGRTA